jgi:hypothetical protein
MLRGCYTQLICCSAHRIARTTLYSLATSPLCGALLERQTILTRRTPIEQLGIQQFSAEPSQFAIFVMSVNFFPTKSGMTLLGVAWLQPLIAAIPLQPGQNSLAK